ncbi:MAG: SMI1/KNR4 family protein [Polyangiaceae bacterium]
MSEAPIYFVREFKTQTKHRQLTLAGKNYTRRSWETNARGAVSGDKLSEYAEADEAEAYDRLMRDVAEYRKQKFELHRESGPLPPGPKEGKHGAIFTRLDACEFSWRKQLSPPASRAELRDLERALPGKLPDGLADFLSWHNGVPDHVLSGGFKCWSQRWFFLSARSIAEHRKILTKVWKGKRDFLPFCDNRSGDYLAVVCADPKGAGLAPGSVVVSWRDEAPQPVHGSYLDFLETFVTGLETGVFSKGEKAWKSLHAKLNPACSR